MADVRKMMKISLMILLGFLMLIIVISMLQVILRGIHPPYKPSTQGVGASSTAPKYPTSQTTVTIKDH